MATFMKAPANPTAFVFLVLTAATLIFLGLELTIWSAPAFVVSYSGSDAIVDSTFLGEYRLGLDRIRIVSAIPSETIIDLRDPGARLPNVFRLRAGENEIEVPGERRVSFRLMTDRKYTLMLCGNNGWGRVKCRSKTLQL